MAGTSAHGLWNYARDFYSAAELINEYEPGELDIPRYYLICHALELGLKAFLNNKGVSIKDLSDQGKFGHDLRALFTKARALGLRKEFRYTSTQWAAIRGLYGYYKSKHFEYPHVGPKRLPAYRMLQSTVDGLLRGISPAIRGRDGLH